MLVVGGSGKLIKSLYEGSKAKAVDEYNAAHATQNNNNQNGFGDANPGTTGGFVFCFFRIG